MLQAIGDSGVELKPVFETVLRHAVRLCAADAGVWQLEGDAYRLAGRLGGSGVVPGYLEAHPIPPRAGTLVAASGWSGGPCRSPTSRGPRVQWHEARKLGGFRPCSACRCSRANASWG